MWRIAGVLESSLRGREQIGTTRASSLTESTRKQAPTRQSITAERYFNGFGFNEGYVYEPDREASRAAGFYNCLRAGRTEYGSTVREHAFHGRN